MTADNEGALSPNLLQHNVILIFMVYMMSISNYLEYLKQPIFLSTPNPYFHKKGNQFSPKVQ